MIDERNNLIRVGDALDAITDWLCNEEFRHRIEPNRTVNKFFAKVMLENVPRVADRKDEPQIEVCDRPQKDCENCWKQLHCRAKDEPQTERSE